MEKLMLKPLKGRKKFAALFNSGSRFSEKEASAVVCFRKGEDIHDTDDEIRFIEIFYAVGVRKKVAKKAIVRNRLKRLLRESLRQLFKEEKAKEFAEAFEIIYLSWNAAPSHHKLIGLKDVFPKVKDLLLKAYKSGQSKGTKTEDNTDNTD
jgi:ribonuclease P protein component